MDRTTGIKSVLTGPSLFGGGPCAARLAEEAAEVAQAALKALRSDPSNLEAGDAHVVSLACELTDLLAFAVEAFGSRTVVAMVSEAKRRAGTKRDKVRNRANVVLALDVSKFSKGVAIRIDSAVDGVEDLLAPGEPCSPGGGAL